MACEVASRASQAGCSNPVCSTPPRPSERLSVEVPEGPCDLSDSFSSAALSPGAQPDERSPDPRVYPSRWSTSWQDSSLGRPPPRRRKLPVPAEPPKKLNIWALIKDFVGKDINHLSVPVHISEPICELQRRAEGFESSYLLDQAAEKPQHSRERLLLVTAYAVSIYSNLVRTTKPFKDLQNSTYELVYPERGYRLIGEKVTHGPATHVMMCEGRKWRFLAYDESDLQFTLQCYIRIRPVGIMSVTFEDGDVYEWTQVPIYIQGLVVGSLKLDHKGQTQVICKATGNRTSISVSGQSTLSRLWKGNNHQVSGNLVEDGLTVPNTELYGAWDQELVLRKPDGKKEVLWKYKEPKYLDSRFLLTPHALELNELTPGLHKRLPRTDVRLRPDMRLFEDGYAEKANDEKDRLEEKQRTLRSERVSEGLPPCTARWFEQVPSRNDEELPRWRYKGGYWEARETGNWEDVPDIYGEDTSDSPPPKFCGKAAVMIT